MKLTRKVISNFSGVTDGPAEEDKDIKKTASVCDRVRILFHPIESKHIEYKNGNIETHLVIIPESFRMLFYLGIIIFSFSAIFVSATWAGIDYDDNPIYNRFGYNNICIFYDFPPWAYFGATLWVPQVVNFLIFEVFDNFRIYDHYVDTNVPSPPSDNNDGKQGRTLSVKRIMGKHVADNSTDNSVENSVDGSRKSSRRGKSGSSVNSGDNKRSNTF